MKLELFNKFSPLFPSEEVRNDETKSSLSFGFECGSGWYQIIYDMLNKLMGLHCEYLQIDQIKEKFGMLRIYYHFEDSEYDYPEDFDKNIQNIIDEAEDRSSHTCEVCGDVGTLKKTGWMSVRCEKHQEN